MRTVQTVQTVKAIRLSDRDQGSQLAPLVNILAFTLLSRTRK